MKRFYSELAANPAHYSFGYSIYGQIEAGDDLDALYAEGFLPFVGATDVSRMMYMARSGRVPVRGFRENTYHTRVRRKLASDDLTIDSYRWAEYPRQDEAVANIDRYFAFRHGRQAMSRERLLKVLTFDPEMRLVEYRSKNKVAGYSIELPMRDGMHQWYYAYTKDWEGKHLGAYLMLDFIVRTKHAGHTHAYLGVTYGPAMMYKTNFTPIEYWNGRIWVNDIKKLKQLLKSDAARIVVATDEWRDTIDQFHPAPFTFTRFAELRFIYNMLVATPRVALFVCMWLVLMAMAFAVTFFP